MTTLNDRLVAEPDALNPGERVYDLAHVRATAHHVVDLLWSDRVVGYLAVDVVDDLHVSFVVFDRVRGPSTGPDGKVIDGEKLSLVLHGRGPSGALRELRHTYWGDHGYLFYPNVRLISAALAALATWFDL